MKYTRRTQDRQKTNPPTLFKILLFSRHTTYERGSKGGNLELQTFLPKTLYVRHYIVLAWDRGSKATNAISTFTPSKINFPSPENFLSDRAEHRARQINCATKNKNPTRGFSHTASAKGEIDSTLLKGVLFFTTILSKRVLFLRRIF